MSNSREPWLSVSVSLPLSHFHSHSFPFWICLFLHVSSCVHTVLFVCGALQFAVMNTKSAAHPRWLQRWQRRRVAATVSAAVDVVNAVSIWPSHVLHACRQSGAAPEYQKYVHVDVAVAVDGSVASTVDCAQCKRRFVHLPVKPTKPPSRRTVGTQSKRPPKKGWTHKKWTASRRFKIKQLFQYNSKVNI